MNTGPCTVKLFTAVIFAISSKLEFLPLSVASILVVYLGVRLGPTIRVEYHNGSILVRSSLANKYNARVEVTGSGKHGSLLRNCKITAVKRPFLPRLVFEVFEAYPGAYLRVLP